MTSAREQFYKRRIAELKAQLKQRDERIAALEKQVAELTDKIAKLSKNSSNSSKPTSSDIVKPTRKITNKTSRKIGAQPGHTKYRRPPFSLTEINDLYEHTFDVCPDRGGVLKLIKKAKRVVQQVEIVENPVVECIKAGLVLRGVSHKLFSPKATLLLLGLGAVMLCRKR